jgi:RNA-binding protein
MQEMQHVACARRELPRENTAEKRAPRRDYVFKLRLQNAHTTKKKKGKNLSEITTRMKRHVRHKLKDEKPTIWIGKDGLTPQISVEIEKQLNKNKMLKIRILKSALQQETAKTIATKAAEEAEAAIVEVRGHVFILYRRRKKPLQP